MLPESSPVPPPAGLPTRAAADVAIVAAAAVLMFVLASTLELAEAFNRWLHRYERWQADELPFVPLVAALGLLGTAERAAALGGHAERGQRAGPGRHAAPAAAAAGPGRRHDDRGAAVVEDHPYGARRLRPPAGAGRRHPRAGRG